MPPIEGRAMRLERPGEPLRQVAIAVGPPAGWDLLIEVSACGVCRTDLHIVDGELSPGHPIIPGH